MTTLDETIALALREHDELIEGDDKMTPEAQSFVIRHVHYATDHLHYLAKAIREAVPFLKTKSWRVVSNIQDEMVTEGQAYSRFLWLSNLRAKITDHIEATYGISFSGLKIYRQVIDKADGKPAFINYDPTSFSTQRGDCYTLSKDGKQFFVPVNEFAEKYVNA